MKRFALRGAALAAALSMSASTALQAQPPSVPPAAKPASAAAPGRVFIAALQDEATTQNSQPGRVTIDALGDDASQPPAADDIPELDIPTLPETTVTARAFPAQPLADDAVVSESRTVTSAGTSGSSITVLTQTDFQNRGARTLNDALRTVPGLDVRSNGGPGQVTSIFTRGTNSSHTKVLLDGIPLNDPSNPNRNFNAANFMLDNVERIEVIRGSQGAVYGSDAIGGVINIVTKRGNGPASLTSTVEGGSFGTYRQNATVSGGNERHWYSFTGAWYQTDGITALVNTRERDGYENGTLSGRAGMFLTDNLDVDVSWRYQKADSEIDSFDFPPPTFALTPVDSHQHVNSEEFFLRTQLHLVQLDGNLEHTAGYNLTKYSRDNRQGSQAFFDGDQHRFDYQTKLSLFDEDSYSHSIVAGVDHTREELFQDVANPFITFPAAAGQTLNGVYIENRFVLMDRLALNAAYRYSDFSRTGNADTYRVSGRYSLDESGTAIHGAVGTGFRTPALAELAAGYGFNPNLVPESSFSWEAGVEQRLFDDRVVIDATYFEIDFNNLINFVFNPMTFNFDAMNVDQANSRGVEVSGQVQVDEDTVLSGGYTFNHARDLTTGAYLPRRPRHKFNLSLGRYFMERRAYASLNWQYVGSRLDYTATGLTGYSDIDSYSILGASAWYEVSDSVRLFARVDNVTDTNYQDVFFFNTAPLSAYGGVTVTWGGK